MLYCTRHIETPYYRMLQKLKVFMGIQRLIGQIQTMRFLSWAIQYQSLDSGSPRTKLLVPELNHRQHYGQYNYVLVLPICSLLSVPCWEPFQKGYCP